MALGLKLPSNSIYYVSKQQWLSQDTADAQGVDEPSLFAYAIHTLFTGAGLNFDAHFKLCMVYIKLLFCSKPLIFVNTY